MVNALQLDLELDLPVDVSDWPYAKVRDYGRRLAAALFLNTLAEARDGDTEARVWLSGWCADYLEALGLDELAVQADADLDGVLVRVNPRHLENYLIGEMQTCARCVHCIPTEARRCRCRYGHWSRELAETTVRYSSKMREYQPCEDFQRKEQNDR